MISVSAAKELIRSSLKPLAPVTRPIGQCAGFVLAADIYATVDIPAFEQSSMDGYAIRFTDKDAPITVTGEVAAGESRRLSIAKGEGMRIFTGAPLPDGADTVVMQEKAQVSDRKLVINDPALKRGIHRRDIGSEIRKGQLALSAGTELTPAAIGFLAGIGTRQLSVYPMPSVSILITGNELQAPGEALQQGQVYEANSFSLSAALREAGIMNIHVLHVEDRLDSVRYQLGGVLEWADLVMLTGGVSVGDYDYVSEAARLCGVQQVFHRVKQRPGKPLYFGMKDAIPVFGLPGNPSSVLSCFYHYVLEAIARLTQKDVTMKSTTARLASPLSKPPGLTQFLKGWFENGEARPLGAQDSYRLSSFAEANCLIALEEGRDEYGQGELTDVFLLP